MNRALVHALFLGVALALTLVVFNFWGDFGRAMYNYFNMTTPPKPSGVVTMKIIPPPAPGPVHKSACDKNHPCPK